MSGKSNYNIEYLDSLLNYLHNPDLGAKSNGILSATAAIVGSFSSKFFTRLYRLENVVLGDHTWYNEAKARQLLIDYINRPECRQALAPQHTKIIALYERLVHLSHGKGNWAEGIDRELLDESFHESSSVQLNDSHELDQMLLNDVFVSHPFNLEALALDTPSPRRLHTDPEAENYRFRYLHHFTIPSPRLLLHIHGEEFGSSSELEGIDSKLPIDYLSRYLRQAYASEIALIELLENALDVEGDLQQFTTTALQKVNGAFQSGRPLLISGGWTGNPFGHKVYYELIPISATMASFRLYNSGAGSRYHHQGKIDGQARYQAYLEWNGIAKEQLESSLFWEALFEMATYKLLPNSGHTASSNIPINTSYDADDLYRGLRQLLKPSGEISAPDTSDNHRLMMPLQRSGVCGWRSLMALVRTKMPLQHYLRLKCDIKLQSLIDFIESPIEDLPRNEQTIRWRLVLKSHQRLCNAIVTHRQRGLIGDRYLQEAQNELKPISQWLQRHGDCRFRRDQPLAAFTYSSSTGNSLAGVNLNLGDYLHEEPHDLINNIGVDYNTSTSFRQINLTTPATIVQGLRTAVEIATSAWQRAEDQPLFYGLTQLVISLSLEDQFWLSAIGESEAKAKAIIVDLGALAQLFLKSCFTIPNPSHILPEKAFVLDKLLFLQEKVCRLGHPDSVWKDLVVMIHQYINLDSYNYTPHYFALHDPALQQQYKVMHSPLTLSQIRGKVLLGGSTVFGGLDVFSSLRPLKLSLYSTDYGSRLIFHDAPTSGSRRSFEDLIRREYPDTIAAIQRSNPQFKTMAEYLQDAHIYASEHLPLWIRAMRNAQVAYLHLHGSLVHGLTTIDRSTDIEPCFALKEPLDFSLSPIEEVCKSEDKFMCSLLLKGLRVAMFPITTSSLDMNRNCATLDNINSSNSTL